MKPKVHYSWLGTDKKKTYLILSLSETTKEEKDTPDVFLQKYCSRIAGVIAALYFTNNEAAHAVLLAVAKFFEP